MKPPNELPIAQAADFFALRTPLLPFDELVAWSADLRAASAAPAELEAALAADRRLLRERLLAIATRPEVQEALFVASPSLAESFPAWLAKPESERGQKVDRSLVRYFTRMASRPTPFGLFAGCSVGRLGDATRLTLAARAGYRRHTRLDGDYLQTLSDQLGREPDYRAALVYRPNSSLYALAGQLRYAESQLVGKQRAYRLVAVDDSDYLRATLARAADGARLGELAQALVDDEVTRADADEYVAELVDSQLLVAELQPQVTGEEPIADLIRQLDVAAALHAPAASVAERLRQTHTALRALDAAPLGTPATTYLDIARELQALPVAAELARLFQVDMVKPAPQATLGPQPLAELERGIALLHRWTQQPAGDLDAFREAFSRRYETREVPLVEALDEELGIGFGRSNAPAADAAPLLDGLAFTGAPGESARTGFQFEPLLARLDDVHKSGAGELVLDDDDVERLTQAATRSRRGAAPPPLPDSFAVLATLAASSDEALASGDFRVALRMAVGPSGANLLGRFCHGDEVLERLVRAHLAQEEARQPDTIFAEIVHLHEGRTGNIMLRPLLRQWELPFLGRSGAPRQQQLQLDDLLVTVRDGRVVLRSRRLGRPVLPRLSTAHNHVHARNLGTYRFLCALQNQDRPQLGFSWGALESARFVPRVRVGRVVVSLARWRIGADALQPLLQAKGERQFLAAQELRRTLRLPRWLALADGDNVLPIDFDNALSVDTLAQLAKDRRQLSLTEIFGHDELCARGPEGRFTHELVVPFLAHRAQPPATTAAPSPSSPPPSIKRLFPPGSEWLYAKLYTGTATADSVLLDVVRPLVQAGVADSWFFIRYADPDWHLRLRFWGDPTRMRNELQPLLEARAAAAIADGRVWKLQYDSYAREVERYGGADGMALNEAIFAADSDVVLALAETLPADPTARWQLTLRGMDQLLDDFALTAAQKLTLMTRLREAFGREQPSAERLTRQVGAKFRDARLLLETLLDRSRDGDSPLAPSLARFDERSARLAPLCATLREREAAGRLTMTLAELAASQLHMHANRMLHAAARAQEYVLYSFLERLYQGRMARQKPI